MQLQISLDQSCKRTLPSLEALTIFIHSCVTHCHWDLLTFPLKPIHLQLDSVHFQRLANVKGCQGCMRLNLKLSLHLNLT